MQWQLVFMFVLIVPLILLPVALIQYKNADSIFVASKTSNGTREE
jgi:maltodextrin utilization protein YvdJ